MITPVLPTYARAPLAVDYGEGPWLFDTDGEKYLDFGAGIAVNALGHANPELVATLEEQARRLWHTSNLYHIPEQEKLAAALCDATFADTVFFTNSGVEAIECSIKMARKYHHTHGSDRYRIITISGAFHGRSLATIAAGGSEKLTKGFGPIVDGFDQVPLGDLEVMEAAITDQTAAIMLEPVLGEGGIIPIEASTLQAIRKMCDDHGILLIFDEIQCGVARTGKLFAHELSGITPDIMGVAKGIGGGFPLGACLATEKAAVGMTAGTHGSTYGGNPMACAVGMKVIEIVNTSEFLAHVQQMGGLFRQRISELIDEFPDMLEDIRGEGLMLGLKCAENTPNVDIITAGYEAKILTVPAADNIIRLLPPLNITEEHISEAIKRLRKACQIVQANQP